MYKTDCSCYIYPKMDTKNGKAEERMNYNREQTLMNRLRIKGRMELTEVVNYLQISESTARRLFTKLEAEGKLIRIHGGIQFPGKNPLEYSFEQIVQTHIEEKNAIGVRACDMLQEGDVLFCDTGTTVLCFCMELARRMEEKPFEVSVYTNSLANFEVLAPVMHVTLIGGEYRSNRKDFSGYLAEIAISKVHFTKCFLGADGCDMKQCFTTTDFDTARMDEMAIHNAEETMILCGSDKFSACTQVGHAAFAEVDKVVTDSNIQPGIKEQLEELGMEVVIVAVP